MMRYGIGGIMNFNGFPSSRFSKAPGSCSPRRNVCFPAKCMASSSPRLNEYAVLGLTPFASKSDVKFAYKRLALKYHPDVIRGDPVAEKQEMFGEIKSAYESLMQKFEEEEMARANNEEFEEWEEWMGFEGGIPNSYHSYNY